MLLPGSHRPDNLTGESYIIGDNHHTPHNESINASFLSRSGSKRPLDLSALLGLKIRYRLIEFIPVAGCNQFNIIEIWTILFYDAVWPLLNKPLNID